MTNEELKVRVIGAFVLILAFTILVPLLISGENVNRDKKYVTRIEQQHNYKALQKETYSAQETTTTSQNDLDQSVVVDEQVKSTRATPEDLDNIRIVENNPPKQEKPTTPVKPVANNQQQTKPQANNNPKPNTNNQPTKPVAKQEEKKQTITVINQQTNKKTVVEVKPKQEVKNNKPDPNYIYDANKKENKPIITTNPTTGNINRYQLQAGVYSTMTNTKNVENQIKATCGTTKIVPVTSNGKRMFKLLCGNSTDINAIQNIQKKLQGKVASTIVRAN